ncbi:MAG: hypothetical protein JST96_11445 [Bacteroidetes bacterium]|nr:hypothetical protein [Bacteroidota bacterium]
MKFTSLLFILSIACIISCKKNTGNTSANITGTWELRQASGMTTINYAPGNGDSLVFTASTYKKYTKGSLEKSGKYRTVPDASYNGLVVPSSEYKTRIIYDDDASAKIFFQRSGNTLNFISGSFADDSGSIVTYELQ